NVRYGLVCSITASIFCARSRLAVTRILSATLWSTTSSCACSSSMSAIFFLSFHQSFQLPHHLISIYVSHSSKGNNGSVIYDVDAGLEGGQFGAFCRPSQFRVHSHQFTSAGVATSNRVL